jgi:malate synthase
MATARTTIGRLHVATELQTFIDTEVLPGTGVKPAKFWKGFNAIVADLAPKNAALLAERERLQSAINTWHQANPGPIADMKAYQAFLKGIGYLVPPPAKSRITTKNVDAELAIQAGPQLVVPVLNARYSLNAANARWGSLYDALYGTDVISEDGGATKVSASGKAYNPKRGKKVIAYARKLLDEVAPLRKGSHKDSLAYSVKNGKLAVALKDGSKIRWRWWTRQTKCWPTATGWAFCKAR